MTKRGGERGEGSHAETEEGRKGRLMNTSERSAVEQDEEHRRNKHDEYAC